MLKLNYSLAACILVVCMQPAHAASETLVTLISLDNTSTLVGLQSVEGKCRVYGSLSKAKSGDYEVVLARKACPDGSGTVREQAIKGKAWIGQLPELPYCAGKTGCLRALPAGAAVTAEYQ